MKKLKQLEGANDDNDDVHGRLLKAVVVVVAVMHLKQARAK